MNANGVIALAEALKASDDRTKELTRLIKQYAEQEYAQKQKSRDLRDKLSSAMVTQNLKEVHGSGLFIELKEDKIRTIPLVDPKDLPPEYQRTTIKIRANCTALKRDLQKQKPEALKVAKLERKPYVCIYEGRPAFKPRLR